MDFLSLAGLVPCGAMFFKVRLRRRGVPGNVLLSEIYILACSEASFIRVGVEKLQSFPPPRFLAPCNSVTSASCIVLLNRRWPGSPLVAVFVGVRNLLPAERPHPKDSPPAPHPVSPLLPPGQPQPLDPRQAPQPPLVLIGRCRALGTCRRAYLPNPWLTTGWVDITSSSCEVFLGS